MTDRSMQQIIRYNLSKNKWAIASLITFIACVSCTILFGIIDSLIVFAIMIVLAITCLFCATKIKETSKTEDMVVLGNPYPLDVESIAEGLPDGWNLTIPNADFPSSCFAMSEDVNDLFIRFPVWAGKSDGYYQLPDEVLPFVPYLREYRNKELSQYAATRPDKRVTGLSSDVSTSLFDNEHPIVSIDDMTRQAVQVTDDAFGKIIVNKKKVHDRIVFDGRTLALDEQGHLLGLAESGLCNEIDIRALIISSDGYVMLAQATPDNPLREAGQIISSASCSLLPSEVVDKPIQECMIDSIHAKIRVLYDIPDNTAMRSSLCGMSRVIDRGGAPEFYCLSMVGMDRESLVKAHRDPTSCFADDEMWKIPTLADGDGAEILRVASKGILDSGAKMSLSACALLSAICASMSRPNTAAKIMGRLGLGPVVPSEKRSREETHVSENTADANR